MISKRTSTTLSISTVCKVAAVAIIVVACVLGLHAALFPTMAPTYTTSTISYKGVSRLDSAIIGSVAQRTERKQSIKSSNEEFESVRPILKKLDLSMDKYLRLLHKSVKLVDIPVSATPALRQAIIDCRSYPRSPFMDNQHSLEVRFPTILQHMRITAEQNAAPEFNLLWHNDSIPPLFYFLRSYQYYVVHCSYNRRNKESWDKGITYLQELSSYVVHHLPEFQRNLGVDFLVPASHPKSGPFGVKTHTISAFQRQTFLRTDFDFTGNTPRDIIVPYYVRKHGNGSLNIVQSTPEWHNGLRSPAHSTAQQTSQAVTTLTTPAAEGNLLLFFAGGKNPPGGLREQLELQFQRLRVADGVNDIVFTTDRISRTEYTRDLHRSIFCAHVRGDTASSSRLFQLIDVGCIPVIVSDWIQLPIESIINYAMFTVRFPESVVHDVRQFVKHLRAIPSERVEEMRRALRIAREMLLFPSPEDATLHRLNPISLTLIEAFMRRQQYCMEVGGRVLEEGDMCAKLLRRLQEVRER